ncbi:hypothetical protein CU098_007689 [Rhizopus stolonifer]|uniref:Uncharacterized protein n=1 Tax=Rhizopus stolonifer TaxID=4846 RepID=A0A367KJ89_RHIST|nr:hypothetical protein CU098_007689 [Rhizopus stolonifer]
MRRNRNQNQNARREERERHANDLFKKGLDDLIIVLKANHSYLAGDEIQIPTTIEHVDETVNMPQNPETNTADHEEESNVSDITDTDHFVKYLAEEDSMSASDYSI